MNWKDLEICLFESARATLERLLAQGTAPLYGAAFHASYREEESVIDLPSLAANSLAALDEDHPERKDEGFWSVKWNPADWRWNWDLSGYGNDSLQAFHEPLQAYANRGSPAQWEAAERRFMASVARAAAALDKHFAKDPRVQKDFIAFFADETGGPDLARTSIAPRLFLKHFPEQDETEQTRRKLALLPEAEQAGYYVQRLDFHEGIDGEEATAWLIAHGIAAQPALLERLGHGPFASRAAMILGLAGVRDPATIAALRGQMLNTEDAPTRTWCASALGYLEDYDWLSTQAAKLAVQGCCANLRAFRDDGAQPARLDYAPLERLLREHPEYAATAEETIRPGSSFCEIRVPDIAEALRGLGSPHAAIRRHAACVLDNRRLGKKRIAEIIAALRPCANDPDEKVRYLAELALESLEK